MFLKRKAVDQDVLECGISESYAYYKHILYDVSGAIKSSNKRSNNSIVNLIIVLVFIMGKAIQKQSF